MKGFLFSIKRERQRKTVLLDLRAGKGRLTQNYKLGQFYLHYKIIFRIRGQLNCNSNRVFLSRKHYEYVKGLLKNSNLVVDFKD